MYIRPSLRRMEQLATIWGMFLICYSGHFLHEKNSFLLKKPSQKMAKDSRNVKVTVLRRCLCVCVMVMLCATSWKLTLIDMSIARNMYDVKVISDKLDCHHISVYKITKFYKRLILFARHATVVKVPNPEENVCL
jgi:hypothetical protein